MEVNVAFARESDRVRANAIVWLAAVLLGVMNARTATATAAAPASPAAASSAVESSRPAAPTLHAGAIEAGIAGSYTSVDGASHATVQIRAGRFASCGPALIGLEPELSYLHVGGLDEMDLELGVSLHRRIGGGRLVAFAAIGGGVREEWLGSFRQARHPLGASVGLRELVDARAALRFEYRYRRILSDPVADFSEHELLAGVTLLFRNDR
jgi:hypothetical protein